MGIGTDTLYEVSKEYNEYIRSFIKCLKEPSKHLKKEVSQKAKDLDSLHKSHCEVQTYFSRGFKSRLTKLQCMERREWAVFLYENFKNEYLQDLKGISPFKDSFLFSVDYRGGLPEMCSELEEYLHGGFEESFMLIIERKGWQTYTGNVYLIVCDSPNVLSGEPFLVYEN